MPAIPTVGAKAPAFKLPTDGGGHVSLGDFKGKLNETAVLYTNGLIPAPRVILVGLGRKDAITTDRARQASGAASRKALSLGCKRVACVVHGGGLGGLGRLHCRCRLRDLRNARRRLGGALSVAVRPGPAGERIFPEGAREGSVGRR